jgi:hypothetical protein
MSEDKSVNAGAGSLALSAPRLRSGAEYSAWAPSMDVFLQRAGAESIHNVTERTSLSRTSMQLLLSACFLYSYVHAIPALTLFPHSCSLWLLLRLALLAAARFGTLRLHEPHAETHAFTRLIVARRAYHITPAGADADAGPAGFGAGAGTGWKLLRSSIAAYVTRFLFDGSGSLSEFDSCTCVAAAAPWRPPRPPLNPPRPPRSDFLR